MVGQLVLIEKLNEQAEGIARIARADGNKRKINIPYALEGEEVEITDKLKKTWKMTPMLSLVKPSVDRIEPLCKHFTACGGCRLQHMHYLRQLAFKQHIVDSLFSQLAPVSPIVGCEKRWQYRSKVELTFSVSYQKPVLGFFRRASFSVIDLEECHLVPQWMVSVKQEVFNFWQGSGLEAYHPRYDTGSLRNLTMRTSYATNQKMVILNVSGNPEYALHKHQIDEFVEAVKKGSQDPEISIFIQIQQCLKGQPTQFYEMHVSGPEWIEEHLWIGENTMARFLISPATFFQPHPEQASILFQKAFELAKIEDGMKIWDVFCGSGTLGILAAKLGAKVVGIESNPHAILDAKENVRINGLEDSCSYYQGDAAEGMATFLAQGLIPDLIMVDPPRSGLGIKGVEILLKAQAKKILYIACNPKTQADDVKKLVESDYDIETIVPVDQFPQTLHVENIVVLKRKNL